MENLSIDDTTSLQSPMTNTPSFTPTKKRLQMAQDQMVHETPCKKGSSATKRKSQTVSVTISAKNSQSRRSSGRLVNTNRINYEEESDVEGHE